MTFEKFDFWFVRALICKISTLWEVFPRKNSRHPGGQFRPDYVFIEDLGKFLISPESFLAGVLKTHFYLSTGPFVEKSLVFGIRAETFQRCYEKCILRVQSNILGSEKVLNLLMFTQNWQTSGESKVLILRNIFSFRILLRRNKKCFCKKFVSASNGKFSPLKNALLPRIRATTAEVLQAERKNFLSTTTFRHPLELGIKTVGVGSVLGTNVLLAGKLCQPETQFQLLLLFLLLYQKAKTIDFGECCYYICPVRSITKKVNE